MHRIRLLRGPRSRRQRRRRLRRYAALPPLPERHASPRSRQERPV